MGLLFMGRMVAFAFTFAVPLVLVRVFSQEDFGLYKQLFLLHGTLLVLLSCGVSSSLYYFLPRDVNDRNAYIFQTLVLLTALGTLGFAGLLLLKGSLSVWLNNANLEPLIPYLGVVTALTLISSILEIVMITAGQAKLASATIVISEFVKAVLIISAIVGTQSMLALLIAMMVLGFLRMAVLVLYLTKESLLTLGAFRGRYLYAQLAYAMPFGAAAIVAMLGSAAPQFYIASLYDPGRFAVFTVGCFTLPLVPLLFDSVSDVTLVKITQQQQAGALDQLIRVLSDSLRKLCLVCFPLFLFLLAVAREFVVGLYTSKFEESISIFIIFIFMIPLTALSVDYVPRAFADTRFLLKMYGLRVVLTLILLFLLTKPLGLSGAALTMVLALAITRVYAWIRVKQLAGATLTEIVPWWVLGKIMGYSIIPGAVIHVLKRFVELPAIPTLFFSLIVFAIIYLGLVWRSDLISHEEKGLASWYIRSAKRMALGLMDAERQKPSRL